MTMRVTTSCKTGRPFRAPACLLRIPRAWSWADAMSGSWMDWVCGEIGKLLRSLVCSNTSSHSIEGTQQWLDHGLLRCVGSSRRFKSPVRVVAAVLLRSRETQAKRAREKTEDIARLRRVNEQQQRHIARLEQDLADARLRTRQLEVENSRLRQQPPVLPDDPRLPHHEFGPSRIRPITNSVRR